MSTPTLTQGLGFPITLTSGAPTLSTQTDLIKSSIKMILLWPVFTRDYLGSFGSRLYEALEEPSDSVLITLIRRFIIDSISDWEKRVELIDIEYSKKNQESLTVTLNYKIKELNIMDSLTQTVYIN